MQQRLTHHLLKGNGGLQIIQAPLINMIGICLWNVALYWKFEDTRKYLSRL